MKEKQTDAVKEQMKAKQMQLLKKYGFYALIGIIFSGVLYVIFSPSSADKEKEEQGKGFNTEIPDPNNSGIIGDKQKAYEQDALMRNKKEKRKSLDDFSSLINDGDAIADNVVDITMEGDGSDENRSPSDDAILKSASSYKNINETLNSFYHQPATEIDPDFLFELEARITELEQKKADEAGRKNAVDEQLAIVEKTYEMASKYMPSSGQQAPSSDITLEAGSTGQNGTGNKGTQKVSAVKQVHEQTVSALAQHIPNPEFIASFYKERNISFNTMDGQVGVSEKNTISAVIHDDQTLMSGQSVRLRLTETMMAGTTIIPANSILTGTAALQGERLGIIINAVEMGGAIIPVDISVYDSDGQYGIFIPNSMELDAIKEVAANMGNSVGTSFTITDDAGAQITSDLTKGAIQGVSQYMQKKIRQVKVHLKSGHKVLLLSKQN